MCIYRAFSHDGFRGGGGGFFTEKWAMPVASLIWNHSLCPGCRLLNKQIGTTRREACGVCGVTAGVTGQAAAWLGLQWVRNQGSSLPLCQEVPGALG